MSTAAPVNDYAVQAQLTVTAPDPATAQTAAQTALGAIKTALAALANATELSVAEDPPGQIAFAEPDGVNGTFSAQGQLLCPAVTTAVAQSAAEAAAAAIAAALAAQPVIVTLQEEEGIYVFELLQ
jgi:hypothetical protein